MGLEQLIRILVPPPLYLEPTSWNTQQSTHTMSCILSSSTNRKHFHLYKGREYCNLWAPWLYCELPVHFCPGNAQVSRFLMGLKGYSLQTPGKFASTQAPKDSAPLTECRHYGALKLPVACGFCQLGEATAVKQPERMGQELRVTSPALSSSYPGAHELLPACACRRWLLRVGLVTGQMGW